MENQRRANLDAMNLPYDTTPSVHDLYEQSRSREETSSTASPTVDGRPNREASQTSSPEESRDARIAPSGSDSEAEVLLADTPQPSGTRDNAMQSASDSEPDSPRADAVQPLAYESNREILTS